jgi:hypothetical protein
MKNISLASLSLAALLAAGSAAAQCAETVEACQPYGNFGGLTPQARNWPTCDRNDLGHQTDRSTCEASRVRITDDSRRCDDGTRRRRHHGRRHDPVHLQPGDQVVVDAPEPLPPAAPPVQRVVTIGRDGTARRAAADAQQGVIDTARALGELARGTQSAVTGLAQAQVEETTQRRAADVVLGNQITTVHNQSVERDNELDQRRRRTHIVATDARDTANEAIRADRFELGTFGSFHLNSGTGTTLGGVSLCVGWVHSLNGWVATRVQGCYSPNLNVQTNAPGVGFLQLGGAAVHAILFARSRFQLALGARGAMAGSDLVGLTWWSFGVDVGVAVSLTNPTTPGRDVRLELLVDPGLAVSHGLDTANSNAPLHGLGGNIGARFGVTAHF